MTERHDDSAAPGRPLTTGEFRAVPDISASTAQFQAFAGNREEPVQHVQAAVPARSPRRMTGLIVAAVIIVLILVVLIVRIA
jgi:cytochrome b